MEKEEIKALLEEDESAEPEEITPEIDDETGEIITDE